MFDLAWPNVGASSNQTSNIINQTSFPCLAQCVRILPAMASLRFTLLLAFALGTAAAQDLPKRSAPGDFDPAEPKLMLNDVPYVPVLPESAADPGADQAPADVAKLVAAVERAKQNAAFRERMCKDGVLSKLEAEQGEMKVVRLMKDLENARLEAAKRDVEEQGKQAPANEAAKKALAEAEARLATATTAAQDANAKWEQAQRAAAELRVWRERKLMALGAGSRPSLKRAEAALQNLAPSNAP